MAEGSEQDGVTGAVRRVVGSAVGRSLDATVGRAGNAARGLGDSAAREMLEELEPYLIAETVPRIMDGVTPHLIDEIVPNVMDGVTSHLIDVTVPQVIDGITPAMVQDLLPRILAELTPYLERELVPQMVESLTPYLIKDIAPQIVDGLMPKIRTEVVPAVLDDIVDDPRVRNLIREQSQGLFLDALERLRRVLAGMDDFVENVVRRLTGSGKRPPAQPGMEPPQGRQSYFAGIVSRGCGIAIDISLASFVVGLGLSTSLNILQTLLGTLPEPIKYATSVIAFCFLPLYLATCWALTGRTIGDALVGTRTTTRQRSRLHFGRALFRAVIAVFLLPLWIVGMITSPFSANRRGLLEIVTGCEVIYVARVLWKMPDHASPNVEN